MAINTTIARSILALTLAVAPVGAGVAEFTAVAYAKGGNGGGGNGGGHSGGGGSNGESHGGRGGKSSSSKTGDRGKSERQSKRTKADNAKKAKSVRVEGEAKTYGLRSLKRNYHAYLNANDPRLKAVAAYAVAYAQYEAEYGVDAVPTDAELSDDALREALAGFTKNGVVDDATLDEAKSILGVGAEVGKIDQIRDALPVEELGSEIPE